MIAAALTREGLTGCIPPGPYGENRRKCSFHEEYTARKLVKATDFLQRKKARLSDR
jgi:hypothetical protein